MPPWRLVLVAFIFLTLVTSGVTISLSGSASGGSQATLASSVPVPVHTYGVRDIKMQKASRSEFRKDLIEKQRQHFLKLKHERELERENRRLARIAAQQRQEAAQLEARAQAAYGDSVWDRIAQCESGGNWATNTGNGYSGGLQMDTGFWATYDGAEFASAPYLASREQQIIVATRARDGYKGYPARGYTPWPVCGG